MSNNLDLTQGPITATHSMLDDQTKLGENQTSTSTLASAESTPLSAEPRDSLQLGELNLDSTPKPHNMKKNKSSAILVICLIAILAGTGTGYGAFRLKAKGGIGGGQGPTPIQQVAGDQVKAGDVFGVQDESTFKDSAEGYLKKGGLGGEGSHRLIRPGGDSQTVLLTSSVTDLDKFDGMEVKVWGETYKGQTAGWLMDVGRIEVVNPKAEAPASEDSDAETTESQEQVQEE